MRRTGTGSSSVSTTVVETAGDESARQHRRHRTLAQLGSAHVNLAPLLAVLRAQPDEPDEVSAAIRQCPVLSARVLSITNSAAHSRRGVIENIDRAVLHLGANRARATALAFGLRTLTEGSRLPTKLARSLWLGSLRKAWAAYLACELMEPDHVQQAYARSLIQDIGLPLLVAMDPDFYLHRLVPGRRGDWSAQEQARFGLDHAEVACELLRQWDAGDRFHNITLTHHQPPNAPRTDETQETCIKIATFLASLMPHMNEELTGQQREWLVSLHGQFLSSVYASPDAFYETACARADAMVENIADPEPTTLRQELTQAVADDTITMITQLCRLEGALCRQREGMDELRFQAFTDPLTKVLNRRGFVQLAERRLEDATRRGLGVCCLVIDLDALKPINDTYGHTAGDRMLRGLAKVLRRRLDRNDLIGRLGGDEFAVLLTGVTEQRAREIGQRVLGRQNTRIRVAEGVEVQLRFSVGAVYVDRADDRLGIETMITSADEAMYYRKHTQKGSMYFKRCRVTLPQELTRISNQISSQISSQASARQSARKSAGEGEARV